MITSVLIAVSLNHALLIERNIVANYRGEPFDENVVYRTKKINNASNLKVSAIHQSPVEIICFFVFCFTHHKQSKTTKHQTNHTLPSDKTNNSNVQSQQNDVWSLSESFKLCFMI